MPGLVLMNQERRVRMQQVLDEVKLEGLIKLVASDKGIGITIVSPDSAEERKEHRSSSLYQVMSTVWMPSKVETKDKRKPIILQAYSPINFELPMVKNETYRSLKERIERESMRAVEHVRGVDIRGNVNAFLVSDLKDTFVVSPSVESCIPVAGYSFLEGPAKDALIPRVTYNLCLFEIEN